MVLWRGESLFFDRGGNRWTVGGADALVRAYHFSHYGWDRLGQVLANQVAGKAWPGSKETIINGLAEDGDGLIASSGMEEDCKFWQFGLVVGAVGQVGGFVCWEWDAPEFVAHMMAFKYRAIAASDGDVVWMENLEFIFVKDGNVTTVTGLTHREKRQVDAGDAVG